VLKSPLLVLESITRRSTGLSYICEENIGVSHFLTRTLVCLKAKLASVSSRDQFPLRPVWIIGIEFHSNNSNFDIYQLS
jgi:hypothetical protein